MNVFEAIVLAIIEGLTEFLPVSSTGHMIIGSSLMGIESDEFVKLFTITIQFGTILSVVVLYFRHFFRSFDFYFKLLTAFIPAVIFGLLFSKAIDQLLESPMTVAVSLIAGGLVLLFADKWFTSTEVVDSDKVSYLTGFKIGLFQCIAMIPGISRSGATIVGGMSQKLSKKAAAEFSFFLAVPTMFAASAKKIYDFYNTGYHISNREINLLIIGNVIGFIVAMLAIRSFIGYVEKHGFKMFGWYRIIVGVIILAFLLSGTNLQII